jgi:hypothetical protein
MTVLVGVRYPKGFVIGSDRLAVSLGKRFDIDKVFWNNKAIISVTGSFYGDDSMEFLGLERDLFSFLKNNNKYGSFISDLNFYFTQLNKVCRDNLIMALSQVKGVDTKKKIVIPHVDLSFVLGLNWHGNNNILFYQSDDKRVRRANNGVISTTNYGFNRFVDAYMKSEDEAINFVEEQIALANNICPEYCSGFDIYTWNNNNVYNVIREKPDF